MMLKVSAALTGVLAVLVLSGCSVGMMPEGSSPSEVRAKVAAMPPEKQIEFIQSSPMKPAEKAAKIAEIKTKYGLK